MKELWIVYRCKQLWYCLCLRNGNNKKIYSYTQLELNQNCYFKLLLNHPIDPLDEHAPGVTFRFHETVPNICCPEYEVPRLFYNFRSYKEYYCKYSMIFLSILFLDINLKNIFKSQPCLPDPMENTHLRQNLSKICKHILKIRTDMIFYLYKLYMLLN